MVFTVQLFEWRERGGGETRARDVAAVIAIAFLVFFFPLLYSEFLFYVLLVRSLFRSRGGSRDAVRVGWEMVLKMYAACNVTGRGKRWLLLLARHE